jgi:arylsulfatase A
VDIVATVAAVVDAALPAASAHDSYNLLSVWKDGAPSPRRSIVHNTFSNGYALRHDQWLLIAAESGGISKVPAWFDEENGYTKSSQPGELYDLSQDLGQRHNLYAENSSKVAELQSLLQQLREKGQVR